MDRRKEAELHMTAVVALGSFGGPDAVGARFALHEGDIWSPMATRRLRAAAAQALRRLGTPAALDVLREASEQGRAGCARPPARARANQLIDRCRRISPRACCSTRNCSEVCLGCARRSSMPPIIRCSGRMSGLLAALRSLHPHNPSVAIGIVGNQLVVADTPMPKASAGMAELIKRLRDHEIERIAFDRGITPEEMTAFVHAIASLGNKGAAEQPPQFPHIHVGRINADERRDDGIGSDMAAIRQLYSNAVSAAQTVWESATVEGCRTCRRRCRRSRDSPRRSPRTAPRWLR